MMVRAVSAWFVAATFACSSTYGVAEGTDGEPNTNTSGGGAATAAGASSTGGSDTGSGGAALVPEALLPEALVPEARCDPSISDDNRELVAAAIDLLFVEEDIGAVELYFEDPYLQHNPIAASGTATLTAVMGPIISSPSFSYTRHRTIAECDLVVVQGEYSGSGVVFDLFRVEQGKIVEHWDSDAGRASAAAGSTPLGDHPLTDAHRVLVGDLLSGIVGGASSGELGRFFGGSFASHRAPGAVGPNAWLLHLEEAVIDYEVLHRTVSDGNYVFTLSEGSIGGVPYALYDLFRLDGGMIVEHWDSSRIVPATTESGLPIF